TSILRPGLRGTNIRSCRGNGPTTPDASWSGSPAIRKAAVTSFGCVGGSTTRSRRSRPRSTIMWSRAAALVIGAALILTTAPARATQLIVGASADTYVLSDPIGAALNFGSLPFVQVGRSGMPKDAVIRGLLHFDISAIPPQAQILSATLELVIA